MSTVFLDEVENCATALAGHRAAILFTFSLSERQIPIVCLIIENTSLIVNYIKLCLTTSKYISCTYWYFILSGGCEIN